MRSFFLEEDPGKLHEGDDITLTGDLYNHIINSLRHSSGDKIILLDGKGLEYEVEIKEIGEESARCWILDVRKAGGEPDLAIYIAQALAKKDNFEQVLQKATEVGAAGFFPLKTRHTVVKVKKSKLDKKLSRWRKIILEAARQSERGKVPELNNPIRLEDLIPRFDEFDLVFLAYARDKQMSLKEALASHDFAQNQKILLLVGPEGGFNPNEIDKILSHDNTVAFNLGPRILRTETVAPLVTGLILYERGEI
ncbi:MAG: RsmE family RNA methyltransferase [Bacillota bacterium]